MTAPSILAAKAEAAAARIDLDATVAELQARLAPRTLARNAWDEVRERGEDMADRGSHFAKRRPAAAAGIVALATLLIARKPVGRGLRRLFSRRPATPAEDPPLNASDRFRAAKAIQEEILP